MTMVIGSFFVIEKLMTWPFFYQSFGLTSDAGLASALLIFSIFGGVVTFWISPLFNQLSRKNEYEADAYAKTIIKSGRALISALKKLSQKNLSHLNPDPIYSAFYHSHPNLQEREKALQ